MAVTGSIFTFWDLLQANLDRHADRVAIRDRGRDVTFRALADEAERIAAWLASRGVGRGARVGVHLPKTTAEVAGLFAAARLGCVFVNINAGLAPSQVAHIASDCDLVALISDGRRLATLTGEGAIDGVPHLLQVDGATAAQRAVRFDDLPAGSLLGPCPAIDNDLAALVYTSGSTGKPKGVMLTHGNIIAGARSVSTYVRNTPDDRILSVMPFSFDYGMNQLTTAFLVGATLVLQPVPMVAEIAKTLAEERASGMGLVPTLWVDFMRYVDASAAMFPALRYVTNTGGKIPDGTLEAMGRSLGATEIFLMYGLTESFRSTWLPPHLFQQKRGAIGVAIPNAEIFVVDPDTGICGVDEPGELLHRGSLVSRGYWRQPELTADKIRPNRHLAHLIGDEPVVHSGDVVRRDADGILWFIGRRDKLIKTSGYRVSPTEVEEALLASGMLAEAFAFGTDDERLGQKIEAAVRAKGADFDTERLLRWCKGAMAAYLVPARIHVRATEFPRNSNGKVDGPVLLRILAGQQE